MANHTEHVFTCPPLVSGKPCAPSTCITAFSKATGMKVVATVSNGDCFFDSLLLSQTIPIPSQIKGAPAQRAYLRKWLVDYMMLHVDPAIMPQESIEELYEAGKYACDAGDLVPLYAPLAFGIRLHVYDLHKEPSQHYVIMRYHYGSAGPVVSILRSGEHFRLLRPMVEPVEPVVAAMEGLSLSSKAASPKAANTMPKATNVMPAQPKTLSGANKYFAALVEAKAVTKAASKSANKYFAALVEAKALADAVKKAQEMNAALAHQLAMQNEEELIIKKAQENANAAYAASLMNGGTRRARYHMRGRRLRTRKTRRM